MTSLAIVRQKYRPDGGAERFVASALSVLSKQNQLNISVLTRQWQGDNDAGFNIIECNPFKWGRVSREKGFARSAREHFPDFDLVQSHERIPGCTIFRAGDGVHKCWLNQRSRILTPVQITRMKNDRFHQYVMQSEKQMFEHPSLRAVICNSTMVKDEICREFDIDQSIIHVIYNSVDLDKFNPKLQKAHRQNTREQLHIPTDANVMLFVGSGFERKGLSATISAVSNTGSHLIIVGKDKKQVKYQQLASSLNCEHRVHFVGVQSDPKVFYGAADGFILPTLYDPFPNVTLEAMASGLGVITSNTCGTAEIITNNQNGYVCDALDIESLTESIKSFGDQQHARKLGVNARLTVEPFTAKRLSNELLSLYNKILKI